MMTFYQNYFNLNACKLQMYFVEVLKTLIARQQQWLASWRLTWQRFGWRQFGVTAGRVHAADFNEAGHEHDEGDAHQ